MLSQSAGGIRPPRPSEVHGDPFVGRQRELAALQALLERVILDQGDVVLLVGEAGAGKTRLVHEFAGFARQRGATILRGSCFEGDWQPAYGPWIEALGDVVRGDTARWFDQLGIAIAPLGQLFPGIQPALTSAPAPLGPDEERYRLFDSVVRLLEAMAMARPIVLVLDDLHWADRDSLRLFRFVARSVSRSPILLVGVYREPDLDAHTNSELAEVLVVLRREADYRRLSLGGLSLAEVAEYLAEAAGSTVPDVVARAVNDETAGNPFFVRELYRHLVETGKLVHQAGQWDVEGEVSALGIPDGVRQTVRRRVARLSGSTRSALNVAAALTGGVEFAVLQTLTEVPDESLLNCIDEALAAGLIRAVDSVPARYDFAHAIVRHALYEELNPDRRARLHRRIVHALERLHAGHELEHAAELAAQYYASASLPGASAGVRYALAAADQARAASAHDRAVTFLQVARDLAPRDDVARRADILRRLAIAEAEALRLDDARASIDAALGALAAAGASGRDRAAFLAETVRLLKEGGAIPAVLDPLIDRGLALLGNPPPPDDLLWARLCLLRNRFETVANSIVHGGRWLGHEPEAVAIARARGGIDDFARTIEPLERRSPAETRQILARARQWTRPTAILRALDAVVRDLTYRHEAWREARSLCEELLARSTEFGSLPGQAEALAQLATIQLTLGELEVAPRTAERASALIARLGSDHRLHFGLTGIGCMLAYCLEGDWPTLALAAAQNSRSRGADQNPNGLEAASFATLGYVRAGQAATARRLLDALTPLLTRLEPTTYGFGGPVGIAAAAVWELGAAEYAATYRQLALDLVALGEGDFPLVPSLLTVARMAALLGRANEAREYFGRAKTSLDASGQRPARAIADYDEARALIRLGSTDHRRIGALLDDAVAAFRELGMPGWVKRAEDVRLTRDQGQTVRLTPREREVLCLLVQGRSSKEIAAELVVTDSTVDRHVANVYAKIGVSSRVEAAAFALSRGLASPLGS